MLRVRYSFLALVGLTLGAPALIHAESIQASLNGFQENPSVSTNASGNFEATVNPQTNEISYTLSYDNMSANVTFAHIHFARQGVNGGVIAWLCDNSGNGPQNTQACPQGSGTVQGTLSATDVVGPVDQGIAAGEFAELVTAMEARAAYVNVHTQAFGSGEIRGQIGRKFIP